MERSRVETRAMTAKRPAILRSGAVERENEVNGVDDEVAFARTRSLVVV